MAGIEAVVSGLFVSLAVNGVVKIAQAYFAARYKDNEGMKEMLDKLNDSLPLIRSVLEFADQKSFEKNEELAKWLQQLRDFIYEAEDVMDDFEAIRIRDSLKYKSKVSEIANSSAKVVKSVLPLTNDEINLQKVAKKIEQICEENKYLLGILKESGNSSVSSTEETSSTLPKSKKIFGRRTEIESIINMIITYSLLTSKEKIITYSAKRKERAESCDDSGQTRSNTRFRVSNLVNPTFPVSSLQRLVVERKEKAESSDNRNQNVRFDNLAVGDPRIKVLPIVGIGGIGKTTIAQVVYNHERVRKYFDTQGWVYVTSSPLPMKFVYDILCAFDVGTSNSTPNITSLSDGHDRLIRAIEHKRFLLVFDDFREEKDWISSTWKSLIKVLAFGARESVIIVTTHSTSIATMIGTLPTLTLDYLPEQKFLSLFEYYAFGHDMKVSNCERTYTNEYRHFTLTSYEETVLRPIGEKIAAKLHGLPLAAVVVGSSLSGTKHRKDWENILESDWWECKNIITSLGVGFHNLDLDLKQCFMYCSLFPRNHVFDKEKLVQMWIAQGFIHPTKAEIRKLETKEIEIEDIGRSKFDKLVDRFFFQSTESKNLYVMHDLIREFAIAISSDMFIYGRLNDNTTIPSSVRHLACDPDTNPPNSLEGVKWNDKHRTYLRTIMFLRYSHLLTYKGFKVALDKLMGLRLLDLSYFTNDEITKYEFPYRNNYQLAHLRFLDLSFSRIDKISTSLCDMVHLQVLDLRGCFISQLPDGMNKLINLRHLYASLETIKLLHGIGRLTNLQELEAFCVSKKKGFTVSELTDLKSLHGQLTISDLKEVSSKKEASLARLEDKKYLTSLIYDVGETKISRDHQVEVLEGLKPHKNIRKLGITKFMSVSLPSWIMEMSNLTGIELFKCTYVETLPPFGSLPSLEVLKLSMLYSITSIGEEFYGASNIIFPLLRELTFYRMYHWTTWSNPSNPEKMQFFPCLQKLQIKRCNQLSGAPILYHCSSLVELCLDNCDRVVKNDGKHFRALTRLTRLNMSSQVTWLKTNSVSIDLHCDHLCELQVLTLENIGIGELTGQTSSLVNLNKLILHSYPEPYYKGPNEEGLCALQLQNTDYLPSLGCIEINRTRISKVLFRLGQFPSLRTLRICYGQNTFTLFENSWLQQLSNLEDFSFSYCFFMSSLPPSLSTLPSLKKFSLKCCPMIDSLPPNGLPRSLEELYIIGCSSELMQGCQPNIGAEWSKISHVPCIRVVHRSTDLGLPAD